MEEKIEQMNLYDYVIDMFSRICDLTDARFNALAFYLNNMNAKVVNLAEFKAVFDVHTFEDIIEFITDMDNFLKLNQYGLMCLTNHTEAQDTLLSSGPQLLKASQ